MTLVSCRVYSKDMTILTTPHVFIYSNERWTHCVCVYGLRSSEEKESYMQCTSRYINTHSKQEFYSIECACTTSALLIRFFFVSLFYLSYIYVGCWINVTKFRLLYIYRLSPEFEKTPKLHNTGLMMNVFFRFKLKTQMTLILFVIKHLQWKYCNKNRPHFS